MNATPQLSTLYPTEFQQLLREKSANFVGREFVFAAITDFLFRHHRGYFTIVGTPGSGKSAILAKYVTENPQVVYYNAQVEGKNQADEFLATLCTQLINYYSLSDRATTGGYPYNSLPDNATQGSWLLALLLQKISEQLQPNQRLIIAIDALDAIDRYNQPAGSNLFYLPRYLPHGVYFILTRRPFLREKSGLLIETPSQILDLADYPEENRKDVEAYIQQACTSLLQEEGEVARLKPWLTVQSENNFMYLRQILSAMTNADVDPQLIAPVQTPGLEAYYQQHWQKMNGQGLSAIELAVVRTMINFSGSSRDRGGISAQLIAEMIDEDEYEVETILENWIEFLVHKQIDGEIYYIFYHHNFVNWLGQQLNFGS